jgi:hypothetical protein
MNLKRFEENKVLGSYSIASLFTKYNFSKKEEEEASKQNMKNNYVTATIFHEWIHHLQIVGTSVGRYLWTSLFSAGGLSKVILNYIEDGNFNRLRRPILFNLYFDEKFKKYIDFNANVSLMSGLMAKTFLGIVDKSQNNEQMKDIFKGNPLFFNQVESPKEKAIPIIKIEDKTYSIGAKHIMESFAWINERMLHASKLNNKEFKKIIRLIHEEPYYVVDFFLAQELTDLDDGLYWLSRMLCDIALNPTFKAPKDHDKWAWEDIHPGWRFVRAVEYLKSLGLKKFSCPEETYKLKKLIYDKFGWIDPWESGENDGSIFSWYYNEVKQIRSESPLAFSLCFEKYENLIKKIPTFKGFPQMPTKIDIEKLSSEYASLTPEQIFHYTVNLGMIGAVILEVLNSDLKRCPLHNIAFSDNSQNKCIPNCEFEFIFKTNFGMTIKEYFDIPLAKKSDIEQYENEVI